MSPNKTKKKRMVREAKALQSIKDQAFGFVRIEDAAICINIELIWTEAGKSEKGFIGEFAKTYTHELLHIIMNLVVDDITEIPVEEEEEIIRMMCGEKWTPAIAKLYAENN